MPILDVLDLPGNVREQELARVWVDGANASALRVAPCLAGSPTADQLAEARLILIGAVTRWSQAGAGALQSQTIGPFSQAMDTRVRTGYNLWPSEIERLQAICAKGGKAKAFHVDTAPGCGSAHRPWCALNFLASYCSCGVDIAGEPIFEAG